ncbi:MAG TPA: hypothetical protein VIP75_02415 [Acidothermales bacterium]
MLVLDSGGVSRLAERSPTSVAMIRAFRTAGLWPPLVPSVVLVESLRGSAGPDARTNQFLKTCDVHERLPASTARRAAALRTSARRGSAVDAVVVALAEPGGTVVTGDVRDLSSLAVHAVDVSIEAI